MRIAIVFTIIACVLAANAQAGEWHNRCVDRSTCDYAIIGDMNKDGAVTATDALLALQTSVGIYEEEIVGVAACRPEKCGPNSAEYEDDSDSDSDSDSE